MKNPRTLSKWVRGAGLLLTMMASLLACSAVWAENIDPDDADAQYAWGENIGWLNAEPSDPSEPGLTVTSTAVTGFAWAENIGWISFSCENTNSCTNVNFGVQNDGVGNLSGYAWGENIGWISFSCHNTSSCAAEDYGVAIDAITGHFSIYLHCATMSPISTVQLRHIKSLPEPSVPSPRSYRSMRLMCISDGYEAFLKLRKVTKYTIHSYCQESMHPQFLYRLLTLHNLSVPFYFSEIYHLNIKYIISTC